MTPDAAEQRSADRIGEAMKRLMEQGRIAHGLPKEQADEMRAIALAEWKVVVAGWLNEAVR